MRKRILSVLLAGCLLLSVGCSARENDSGSDESASKTNDIVEEIPESVQEKLQSAIDVVPVRISGDAVTDEAVKDLIYIGGEKLKSPFTLSDFGEGVKVIEDDKFISLNSKTTAFLTYYGMNFASCIVEGEKSVEEMYNAPITYISFVEYDYNDESDKVYPVSINGITLNSTLEEAENALGFMEKEESSADYYILSYENGEFLVKIYMPQGVVSNIRIEF